MRNVDWYKEELIKMANKHSYVYVSNEKVEGCGGSEQFIKFIRNEASRGFIEWLYEEHKVGLSTLEYEVLKYFYREGCRYIARDKDNELFLYKNSPIKSVDQWIIDRAGSWNFTALRPFGNLFSFVRWEDEKPTSICEILKKGKVIGGGNY